MSTVILDTITGKSTATTITIGSTPVVSASANSMTIRGEGTAQTSIQQGLAKYWITFTQSSNAVGDSFNHTSATDNGTGDHTLAIANDFSSAEHAAQAQHMQESGNSAAGYAVTKARATGSIQIQGLTNDRSALVDVVFQVSSCGDLA
jgi:hypothetical protein